MLCSALEYIRFINILPETAMYKTPLYDEHLKLGAKIIDFGGWAMPVQYTNVIEEHRATREAAGLFDICHMGEIEVKGPRALELLQRVMSRNLGKQEIGQMKLSLLLNEQGGIIDDLTIYRLGEDYYLIVTNAATKDKDLNWIKSTVLKEGYSGVELVDVTSETGKIDLQGPLSQTILQSIVQDSLANLKFYHFLKTNILNTPAIVSRSGYTGEDGFEIYVSADAVARLWNKLLDVGTANELKPCGLGARDTLRLESGMMLYGNELHESVTPLEVVYGWAISLEKDFIGSDVLRKQKAQGVNRKLVGFEMRERGIARHGYKVVTDRKEIGKVTSGTFSPTLQKAIGMAFVPSEYQDPGTEISIRIREHAAKAVVVPMPFYKRK
jgi:aminomethyltransferase